MSGIYTDFWRIVKPSPSKNQYVQSNTEAAKLYSNFSWYTKVMKGASSRFSKYNQYKNMDSDVFVARALDTIAEEMCQINVKTNMPFLIEYQNENNQEVPESITMTVRAALRHWIEIQDLNTIIFDIARTVIKFGDCFFRKNSDFKKWQYIDPSDIIGISISGDGKPEHYHLRVGEKNKQGAFGDVVMVPAAGIIHFTLSSSMGDNGPFGESILFPTIKAFRHLSLLEDSVIIYRIVRAPERRVFFVDVGNMPPQRVKAYLEAIKNELKQKRIPNESGGTDKIDSVYNPMCLALDTKIPLLDGRTLSLQELITEHHEGKQNWTHSCDPLTGAYKPGLISWAGVTRKNAEIVQITLDNGKTITCTPDHKFPVLGKGFVSAEELTVDDPLISYETRDKKIGTGSNYEQVFDHAENVWKFTHCYVAEFFKSMQKHQSFTFAPEFSDADKNVVHHKDYNSKNNHPANLTWMNHEDHNLFHQMSKQEWWTVVKDDPDRLLGIVQKISAGVKKYAASLSTEEKTTRSRAIDHVGGKISKFKNQPINITRDTVNRLAYLVKTQDLDYKTALEVASNDKTFTELLAKDNDHTIDKKGAKFYRRLTQKVLMKIYEEFGYKGWKHFKECAQVYNHRIVKIEHLEKPQDTGCITIDGDHKYHDHHTFALEAGVFTKNSMTEDYFFAQTADGRGSRVETLSGGENLGEIADLNFFQNKFLQGLRIPSSYMRGAADGGAQINDGKVGVAYIEELRFANYVARLQSKLHDTFDDHFKAYLKSTGINIDKYLFKIKLVDPQNFMDYKQAEVDEKMISNYSNVKDNLYLSERYKQKHYLGLSEDDVQENEVMLKQERGIPNGGLGEGFTELRMLYDPAWVEKRPEIKVSDDYDNFEELTTKKPTKEEVSKEASEEKPENEETSKKEAEVSSVETETSDSSKEEIPVNEPSTEDLDKEIAAVGKE